LGNLDPAITELAAVVGVLNQQQVNLQSLINNGATVLTTVGQRSADLQSLVTAGDQVLSATAARDTQLVGTIDGLPPFLTQLRTTLGDVNTTLGIAKPSLAALRPNAALLTPALSDLIQLSGPAIRLLHQAPALLKDANAALPSITRFTNAFDPAVRAILPAAEQVIPMIGFIGMYANDLVTAMVNYSTGLEAIGPAATTTFTMGTPAGKAHYARVLAPINNEILFGQTVREPTNRHSAYYAPGALGQLLSGLTSSDCQNIHNTSQVPLGGANVPCVPSPPFSWGAIAPTTKSSYYPHLTPKRP
jgi:ABC-type transporter Mla subunit MlaD